MRDQFGFDSSDYDIDHNIKDVLIDRRWSIEPQQPIDAEDDNG